ncbi:MAG: putative addiction module antidote protein [Gammaproteobacteria bacterium]|nr:putative addiction module antidote protein [Gammaproteobacteria bacterium]
MPRRKARETFSRYDTAEGLNTEEDIARYLEAVLDEGGSDDPAFLAVALGNVARARNMSQLARDTGISREGLYKALSGDGNPSLATVMKIARALGLQLTFRPAGQARAPRTGRGGSRSAAAMRA